MFPARTTLPALLTIALALGGCAKLGVGAAAKASAAPPAASPFLAVAEGKADVEGGVIQVAARTAGIVKDVYVQEGDTVKKGQVLARQEDDAQRLAVRTAQADLDQARAATDTTDVQLATAKRELARLQPLDAERFVARQALDNAADAVKAAEATLASQHAAVGTAQARLAEARYALDLTVIRAPADGRIVRRYANPGAGASTLNVSNMFDLEPAGQRIVRAEVSEGAEPFVFNGEAVQLVPEAEQSKAYSGRVLRRAPVFGARKLQSDDPGERSDERVVEVVVTADGAPFLIGQRVLVKFLKGAASQG
ncbi:MAG: efflux RND transporter periplasmic adaptor subunit [Caulobacterales bacterium]